MTDTNRSADRRRGIQRTIAGAALAAGLAVGIAAPVAAQEQYPEVGGTTIVQRPEAPNQPEAPRTQVRGTNQSRGSLPVTGGDVAGMAAIGAVLVAGGAIAVSSSRRRAAA